jgi:hypothetical protein
VQKPASSLVNIKIDPSHIEPAYDIAGFVSDTFDILQLETTDDCLIGKIDKVIYKNGVYYILDKKTSSVFLFDSRGKYISKLSKKGEGADEYTSLDAFVVSDNGDVWISDTNVRSLIGYDKNFKLVKKIKLWDYIAANDLAFMGNKIYMASNWDGFGNHNMQLASYDANNSAIDGLLYVGKRPDNAAAFIKNSQLSLSGDDCLLIYSYCDSIFQVADNEAKPKYKISFKERYNDIPYSIEEFVDPNKENIIKGIEDIKQLKENILLGYFDHKYFISAVYNRNTHEAKSYYHLTHSRLGNMIIYQYATYVDDDNLIASFEPEEIMDVKKNIISDIEHIKNNVDKSKVKQVLAGLKSDSNPILVRFKLK